MVDGLIDKVLKVLLAPFASQEAFVTAISGVPNAVMNLNSQTGWLYLLVSIVIATAVYLLQSRREGVSLVGFLFPRDVFLQRSAIVDYKFVAFDLTIKTIAYGGIVGTIGWVLYKSVVTGIGATPLSGVLKTHESMMVVATPLVGILLTDFCYFYAHYLMHKIRFLWYFHEVHHSAEVLTPVTVYRTHPVEALMNAVVAGLATGLVAGLYTGLTDDQLGIPTILGVNIVNFLFFTAGSNLRHSHVWLSYGPWLSHLLISPAMHQIHHSQESRHQDKNFGYIFAFWDVLFNSTYVPKQREEFRLGVAGADPNEFLTITQLYVLPFKKSFACLWGAIARRRKITS